MDGSTEQNSSINSPITYDDVITYREAHLNDWKSILNKVEGKIIEARDKHGIPVYSTKCRIKSIDSIYLKTKRKVPDLEAITDYSGLRVLCLFEEDLLKVHKTLLETIQSFGLNLVDFKLYNFTNTLTQLNFINLLNEHIKHTTTSTISTKLSGYKSIHYIVYEKINDFNCYLEIQLRTLLQDVWGELEHALSYKRGMIHPHIKKSFMLLARDIETNDILMSHLNEINEKEKNKDKYGVNKFGLRHYFQYEEDIFPSKLQEKEIIPLCRNYVDTMDSLVNNNNILDEVAVTVANDNFKKLKDAIFRKFGATSEDDTNLTYWLEMEKALLLFVRGKHDEANELYEKIAKKYTDRYVLYFRLGEIHLINGEIALALRDFDRSNIILNNILKSSPTSQILYQNLIRIKRKLAYVYWMLGEEYIDHALSITNEIQQLITSKPDIVDEKKKEYEYGLLYNNLCWYQTEKWQSLMRQRDNLPENERGKLDVEIATWQNNADDIFQKFSKILNNGINDGKNFPSNWYDTAAYYCYCTYLQNHDPLTKDLAKRYAKACDRGTNYATLSLTSLSIQINHITEIMSLT